MQTPLLAQENQNEIPALSGPSGSMEEESALSRLIAESTPLAALMPFSPALDEMTTTTNMTPTIPLPSNRRASLTTVIASTLVCLQWGLTWGAYFSKSWIDSHLQISIGWQRKYMPWIDDHTDVVVQETSVFSLAATLRENKEYFSLAGMWLCSVVLPCMYMIICPIWILTDYTVPPRRKHARVQQQQQAPRDWLQLTIRLSLLVVFVILILDVAISGIGLAWEDTDLQVENQINGAYLSYLLGCTCALLSVVVLRMPFLEHLRLLGYRSQQLFTSTSAARNHVTTQNSAIDPTPPQALRAPPSNAFRLPWLSSNPGSIASSGTETERLVQTTEAPAMNRGPTNTPPQHQSTTISRWQTVVLFQSCLLALLLWIPALALGQFRVLYNGLVVNLIKTPAFNVYLWEIPQIIWHTALKTGTPKWILVLTFSILALFVAILPLLAHLIAVLAWFRPRSRPAFRDMLRLLEPTLCGIPFAVAIIVTVPAIIDIGEDLDKDICTQIENVIQNQCLVSGGVHLAGCWFFLAQTICLELFVFLTIRWAGPNKRGIHVTV